jgi:hypothetical protein
MKVLTVATKKKFFYNKLVESLQKNNIELITLGIGKKYNNHLLKDKLVLEYLQNIKTNSPNEVIVFIDGYDSVVTEKFHNIEKEFIDSNKNLIISYEDPKNFKIFHYIMYLFTFGFFNKKYLNTGMYIGKAEYLYNTIIEIRKDKTEKFSNQIQWQNYYNKYNNSMELDDNNKFFLNVSNKRLCQKYMNKLDDMPYIISSPGIPHNIYNFCLLLNKMGYNTDDVKIDYYWIIKKIFFYKKRNLIYLAVYIGILSILILLNVNIYVSLLFVIFSYLFLHLLFLLLSINGYM